MVERKLLTDLDRPCRHFIAVIYQDGRSTDQQTTSPSQLPAGLPPTFGRRGDARRIRRRKPTQSSRRILARSEPHYLLETRARHGSAPDRPLRVDAAAGAQSGRLVAITAPRRSEPLLLSGVILITCPASVPQYSLRISPFWLKIAKNLAKN